MNKVIKNIVEINNKLSTEIPLILNESIITLKKLVENESITSFSFFNNDIYLAREKHIFISISTEKFDDIRLGLFETMTDLEKSKNYKLSKDLKKDLEDLNSTLYILNEHFPKYMPTVKQRTYFSIKAVHKEGDFATEKNLVLLPEFKWNDNKNDIKEKKVKKNKIK